MADIPLLKFLSKKSTFERFRKYIKSHTLLKETEQLLDDIEEYWKMYPSREDVDWDHFAIWHKMVRHPTWEATRYAMYDALFKRIVEYGEVDTTIVDRFIQLDYTAQIRDICDAIIRGDTTNLGAVAPILDKFTSEIGSAGKSDEDLIVTSNIRSILDDLVRAHGYEWRLEDLNLSVGPLHGGDFVIVGARPETGKTTFITSEFTYMAAQLPDDKDAIIFNNEEDGRKLFVRLVQSALNFTIMDIAADEVKAEELYIALLKRLDRIKVVHKDSNLTIYDIDRFLKSGNYGLVGINVLDKVGGFDRDDNEVSRGRKVAQYIRNMAVKYKVAIIAVMQADASGEGKAWLDQSQLYGSKTGIQGEADVILMIGKQDDEGTRYVNVVKNKLPGGGRTVPKERHGKFEVRFDPEKGRYESKHH